MQVNVGEKYRTYLLPVVSASKSAFRVFFAFSVMGLGFSAGLGWGHEEREGGMHGGCRVV